MSQAVVVQPSKERVANEVDNRDRWLKGVIAGPFTARWHFTNGAVIVVTDPPRIGRPLTFDLHVAGLSIRVTVEAETR